MSWIFGGGSLNRRKSSTVQGEIGNSFSSMRVVFSLTAWPLVFGALLWLSAYLLFGDTFRLVRLGGYFQLLFALVLIPVAFGAFFLQKKLLALTAFCLTFLLALPSVPLFIPRLAATPPTDVQLKILSYSVNSWHKDLDTVAEVIKQKPADMVLTQGAPRPQELRDRLAGLFPSGGYALPSHGVVASRYPLSPLQAPRGAHKVRVDLPTGPITVWNVHTSKEPHYREQVAQVEAIVADVLATEGPKIVAGDFNTTPGSAPYRMLEKILFNAHHEAGWGFGFTYPTPSRRLGKIMPFLRIDHIWYSKEFYALEAGTLSDHGGSDHFPVWAQLGIIKK